MFYIGSSNNIHKRYKSHINKLSKNKHSSELMQNDYNNYGISSFELSIISIIETQDREIILDEEQKYLDILKPWDKNIGYNNCKIARSPAKSYLTEVHKNKIREKLIGHSTSEETREKMRMNRVGIRNPQDSIDRMRLTKIGLIQTEENINKRAKNYSFIKDGLVYEGRNLKRFADLHGLSRGSLRMVLHGIRKTHKGFRKNN